MIQNGDPGAVATDEQVQVILGKFPHTDRLYKGLNEGTNQVIGVGSSSIPMNKL